MPQEYDWGQAHPSPSKHATEKEQLLLQIRATIEFGFGSMCDRVEEVLAALDPAFRDRVVETLKRDIRTKGNTAIRHIEGHAQNYNISRKHEKDKINKERVLKKHFNKEKAQ